MPIRFCEWLVANFGMPVRTRSSHGAPLSWTRRIIPYKELMHQKPSPTIKAPFLGFRVTTVFLFRVLRVPQGAFSGVLACRHHTWTSLEYIFLFGAQHHLWRWQHGLYHKNDCSGSNIEADTQDWTFPLLVPRLSADCQTGLSEFPVVNGYRLWYGHYRTSSSSKRKIMNQLPWRGSSYWNSSPVSRRKHGSCLLPTRNSPTSTAADFPIAGSVNSSHQEAWQKQHLAYSHKLGRNQLRAFSWKAGFPLLIACIFSLQQMSWKWDTYDIVSLL